MNDAAPTPLDYTHLAVQIGVLQEGNRNILEGVNDIKTTLANHGDRIGVVESHAAATDVRLTNVESAAASMQTTVANMQEAAKPAKGWFWGAAATVTSILALGLVILNQLYGK